MSRWIDILFGIVVGLSVSIWYFDLNKVYQQPIEQSNHCYDTKKQTAWISRRAGELRCFLEYKEFPHKVIGININALENP